MFVNPLIDENIEKRTMILDSKKPFKSTGQYASMVIPKRPTELVIKSHMNLAVYDLWMGNECLDKNLIETNMLYPG